MKTALAFLALAAAMFVVACSGGSGGGGAMPQRTPAPYQSSFTSPPTAPPSQAPFLPQNYIKHVVFVIQENRSFDNLFYGYPGADTATSGPSSTGQTISLQPTKFEAGYDINHNEVDFLTEYDGGKMDGFNLVGSTGKPAPPNAAYGYVPHSETQPYFQMASQFVLADRMFATQIDKSFTAHQFLIAAQSGDTVDTPSDGIEEAWGCDAPAPTRVPTIKPDRTQGPGVFPCFDYLTLADELDAKGVSWRYYAPAIGGQDEGLIWSAYDAVTQIRYGPDWSANVISPPSQFLTDVSNGTLAGVTWIVPDYADSDHGESNGGPAWVQSVVNAIGSSPVWSSTAVFVIWDDWGGWYDHVAPAQISTQSLGMRVPLLVISPYAKTGYVSHVNYESAGLLQFAETVFGVAPLAPPDSRALNFADCFDFGQKARPYAAIRRHLSTRRYVPHSPSGIPPDD